MSYPFSAIIIIYNPNSTGNSKQNATKLKQQLVERLPKSVRVILRATKHAGHAEEIGAAYAKKDASALLVSSSGDGGYNELINGVLKYTTKDVATVVLPSGNANDHHHATNTNSSDLIERIVAGKTTKIDALAVEGMMEGKTWRRYAHSYAGIGLTAYIGKKLTEADLNPVNEKWLTLKYLLRFKHVTIRTHQRASWHRYSSIVVGNIDRMSKVIKLDRGSQVDDGKFEVYELRERSFLRLIAALITGSTFGMKRRLRTDRYTFIAKRPLELQCDGEVFTLDGQSPITITAEHKALTTLR